MKRIGLISGLLLVTACTDVSQTPSAVQNQDARQLPVFQLSENGVQAEQVQQLMNQLGIDIEVDNPDPFAPISYLDTENFMNVPSKVVGQEKSAEDGGVAVSEAFDFGALENLQPFDPGRAVERTLAALDAAGMTPSDIVEGLKVESYTDTSTFSLQTDDGKNLLEVDLDTHVLFDLKLGVAGGVPISGPGGKVKAVFDPEGRVTQLYYGLFGLEQIGATSVLSEEKAARACEEAYASNAGLLATGAPKLTYYVPYLPEADSDKLTPSYVCEGYTLENGTMLTGLLIDASTGKPHQVGPSNTLPEQRAESGLRTQQLRRVDFGVEYVGVVQGLPNAKGNAHGFAGAMRAGGVAQEFIYGNTLAWERDFKDPSYGGADQQYADNVDLTYYYGHGNPDGFTFEGPYDDGFLHRTEAKWGNRDAEWLIIEACSVLALNSGGKGFAQRWGSAFDGLHQILSYENTVYDVPGRGHILAKKLLGKKIAWFTLKPRKVRQSWVETATWVQPTKVNWAVMGPVKDGEFANYNDYFHGRGKVSADIRGANVFWHISGPS